MKNVNESGRSMVEMLGVLAIIGVLSIGGIAGYTMAMNRYRANEVVDAASKMAVVAMVKQSAPWNVEMADIGLSGGIAGSGCTLSVANDPDKAQAGIVDLAIAVADDPDTRDVNEAKAGCSDDVVTAIKSIAGNKYNSDGKYFQFDGNAATSSGS